MYGVGFFFWGQIDMCDATGTAVGYLRPPPLRNQWRFLMPVFCPTPFHVYDVSGNRIGGLTLTGGFAQAVRECHYQADSETPDTAVTGGHLLSVALVLVSRLSSF